MKAAALFLTVLCLCACKSSEQPKVITVAFNGWHGQDFLKQGCTVLQRDYQRVSKMSAKEYATLMTLTGKHYMPCLAEPDVMNRGVENQLLTVFAANSQCQGVRFSQGYYGPNDSTPEAGQKFLASNWRLSLDLTPSAETGEISLADSQWTLDPKILSGSLANIEKAATDICTIIKGQGGQI